MDVDKWNDLLGSSIAFLSQHFGLPEALSIVLFTLLVRLCLMPISFSAAYRGHKNKLALAAIKPEVDHLKEVYKDNPAELAKRTMSLYSKHGISFFDKKSILNLGTQSLFGIAMYHALRNIPFTSKFLWIASIGKPDVVLTLLVGLLTFLSMMVMPGMNEHHSMIICVVASLFSIYILISTPSVLGLYWVVTNFFSIGQSLFLRYFLYRESQLAISK